MKNKLTLQPKKAFTLVELIVVVTILAIIGTIGFVSYTDYLSGVRDTNRTVQLESIGDGLKLSLTKGRLPIPDDYIEVKTSGDTIAYQGYAGEEVLKKIKYDKEGKDPLDNTYFSYYATDNRKNFQLMALLEETNETVSLYNRREVLSEDIDYSDRQVKVSGKKLGILTGGGDNLNVPVQEIGEIKDNGELDIATTPEEYISHIDDNDKISGNGSELIKSIYNASCKRILESSLDNGDGIYKINPAGTEEFEVYCDMETDGGGWTLIESFSLENKDIYTFGAFYEDLPRNENTPKNFEDFRLSLSKMEDLVDISTEVRAGCNMEINPSKDYVFFDLSELNILTFQGIGEYKKTKKLNVRGNFYENEDLKWWQGNNIGNNDHLHIDSNIDNIPNSIYSEDNFGHYRYINQEFSCTSSQSSTTNWYLR